MIDPSSAKNPQPESGPDADALGSVAGERSGTSGLRVLLCARAYPPDIDGGGEESTALLARGLSSLGVSVRVLTLTNGEPHRHEVDGIPVERVPSPWPYWSLQAKKADFGHKIAWHLQQAIQPVPTRAIREAVERASPQIVHSSTIEDLGPGLWRWASAQGLVTVHTLRSYNLLHRSSTLYDARKDNEVGPDLLAAPKRRLASSLDGVVGVSRYILTKHLENRFCPEAQTTVIPDPIAQAIEIAPVGHSPRIRLGVLGRISPEQGIEQFLVALQRFAFGGAWELEIIGDGDPGYVQRLKGIAEGMPIRFAGRQERHEFLKRLDLLVVPSRWQEPFGSIISDAYSVGLPVLCLRRGGLPELVREGVTGWVLDDWSELDLNAAITGCRQLDRARIAQEAERYSIDEVAREYLAFYKRLL